MVDTPHSLLERLARDPHDEAAWRRLVELYEPFLKHWCRRLADLPGPDADDVVQGVLAVMVERLPAFAHNGRVGALRAWLRTTLVYCVRDHGRRVPCLATEEQLAQLVDPASELSGLFDDQHNGHVVRVLLARAERECSAHDMALFRQVVLEGGKVAEVASKNGVTDNAVYLAKSRVLNWLRREGRGLIDDGP